MGQSASRNEFEQGINQQDDGYDQREQYPAYFDPMALQNISFRGSFRNFFPSDDGFRNGVFGLELVESTLETTFFRLPQLWHVSVVRR